MGPLYSMGSIKTNILFSIIRMVSNDESCFSKSDKGRHRTHTNILQAPFFKLSTYVFVSSDIALYENFF